MYQITVTFKSGVIRRWYYRDMENAFKKYAIISQCPSVKRTVLWKNKVLSLWPPRAPQSLDELRKAALDRMCHNSQS